MTQLTVSTQVYAPLQTVRTHRNDPASIIQRNHASDDRYCPKASNDLCVGGMLIVTMAAKDGSFEFDYTAQYDVIEPLSRIELTMGAFEKHFVPAGRRVVVTFVDNGSEGVVVTEVFDADDVHKYDMQIAGRQAILENFKKYVESV